MIYEHRAPISLGALVPCGNDSRNFSFFEGTWENDEAPAPACGSRLGGRGRVVVGSARVVIIGERADDHLVPGVAEQDAGVLLEDLHPQSCCYLYATIDGEAPQPLFHPGRTSDDRFFRIVPVSDQDTDHPISNHPISNMAHLPSPCASWRGFDEAQIITQTILSCNSLVPSVPGVRRVLRVRSMRLRRMVVIVRVFLREYVEVEDFKNAGGIDDEQCDKPTATILPGRSPKREPLPNDRPDSDKREKWHERTVPKKVSTDIVREHKIVHIVMNLCK